MLFMDYACKLVDNILTFMIGLLNLDFQTKIDFKIDIFIHNKLV